MTGEEDLPVAYGDAHAAWYDAFYEQLGKDHAAEVAVLLDVAGERLGRTPGTWLDVACGTGQHLAMIADQVTEVVGVDLSPEMLDVARARLGGRVELRVADQRDLRLERTFDVVSSLFSSIGYAKDEAGLDRTVAALGDHVAPGGVLIVEPWVDAEAWEDGRTQVLDVEEGGARAVRVLSGRREGDSSVLEVALVTVAGGRVTVDREEHRLLLVPHERVAEAVRRAGFDPTWVASPGRRGLLVATRSTT